MNYCRPTLKTLCSSTFWRSVAPRRRLSLDNYHLSAKQTTKHNLLRLPPRPKHPFSRPFSPLCATVTFGDGVESANIVGFNTLVTDGTRSPLIGISFTPVNGGNNKLGDFAPVDGTMSADEDNLQKINPTTLGNDGLYVYCDKTTADAIAADNEEPAGTYDAWIGWWDAFKGIGSDEEGAFVNETPVTPGMGFMGYFESGNEISFVSSGSAPLETTSITTDGTRSPVLVNYVPRQITLGDFAPVDGTMSADEDNLQKINPTTLGNDGLYVYCDKTTADAIAADNEEPAGTYDAWIGWWDAFKGIGSDEEGAFVNGNTVEAGAGFMGYFESGNEITFQLPPSVVSK